MAKLCEIWNKEGKDRFFFSFDVIGRSQFNTELLEGFLKRNSYQRKRFISNDTDARKNISAASRKHPTTTFLVVSPMSRRIGGNGHTIHTYVLVVSNEDNIKSCKYSLIEV